MGKIDFLSHEQICLIYGNQFMTYFESHLIIKSMFNLTPYKQ